MHASNATRFEEGYKTIAERVQVARWKALNSDILRLVSAWLREENKGHWVMIVHIADAAAVMLDPINGSQENSTALRGRMDRSLSEYIPQVSHGSVLTTSRSRSVAYCLPGRTEDVLDINYFELRRFALFPHDAV